MSLDVYLELPGVVRPGTGVFIREAGSTREITRAEWDEKFPGCEPVSAYERDETETVYSDNITHNLGAMAHAAGIYKHLWRPEEIGIETAEQLIVPLADGLARLQDGSEVYKQHAPSNGWGDHAGLVRFVRNYLEACRNHPQARVRASR